MNAFVLAAGLGTRLKPWTLHHPKALVPVGGIPMLERVLVRLKKEGFDEIVVNVHHFASQIIDFLNAHDFGLSIKISDETGTLLDTGGGLVKGYRLFNNNEPVLIHNVDILSNASLNEFMQCHFTSESGASLLLSDRKSSRKLIVGKNNDLKGWHNITTGEYKPDGFPMKDGYREYAFSGIHAVSAESIEEMFRIFGSQPFPIMEYYLNPGRECRVNCIISKSLEILDIGKPEALAKSNDFIF